jgi:hypothetical protein
MQWCSQSPSAQLAERPSCKQLIEAVLTWPSIVTPTYLGTYSACRGDDRDARGSFLATNLLLDTHPATAAAALTCSWNEPA